MDKQKQKNKKMTLDGLAVLMKQGFGRIDKKLETNQESMATMVKTAIQTTQDSLVERIDQLDKKFEGEFKTVRYQLDKIDIKLDGQEKTIFSHDRKIDRLEVELKLKKV